VFGKALTIYPLLVLVYLVLLVDLLQVGFTTEFCYKLFISGWGRSEVISSPPKTDFATSLFGSLGQYSCIAFYIRPSTYQSARRLYGPDLLCLVTHPVLPCFGIQISLDRRIWVLKRPSWIFACVAGVIVCVSLSLLSCMIFQVPDLMRP
jgi:hypothetical protein